MRLIVKLCGKSLTLLEKIIFKKIEKNYFYKNTKFVQMSKLIIVGDSRVGKSSYVEALLKLSDKHILKRNGEYTTHLEEYHPTLGVDLNTYTFDNRCYNIWDLSGQPKFFGPIRHLYMKDADCAIIMFDYTNKKSIDNIKYWFNEIMSNCNNELPIVLCGNKYDNSMKKVEFPEFHQCDISIKERRNCDKPFEYFSDVLN